MVAKFVESVVRELEELEVLHHFALGRRLHHFVRVYVLVLHAEEDAAQPDGQGVAFEFHVAYGSIHDRVEVHAFHRRVVLLLGLEVVQIEFVVGVRELAAFEEGHELVLGDGLLVAELLPHEVCDVTVEDGGHFVVDVQFERGWFVHVHVQVQPGHQVDVLSPSDRLARGRVKLATFALAELLDHILLEDSEDVSAVGKHTLLVSLFTLEFNGHLQVVGLVVVCEDSLEGLVWGGLYDFYESVVLHLASYKHVVQFLLHVEGAQNSLAQVLILLNSDSEICLFLVHTRKTNAIVLHSLVECEVDKIGPDALVSELLATGLAGCWPKLGRFLA